PAGARGGDDRARDRRAEDVRRALGEREERVGLLQPGRTHRLGGGRRGRRQEASSRRTGDGLQDGELPDLCHAGEQEGRRRPRRPGGGGGGGSGGGRGGGE